MKLYCIASGSSGNCIYVEACGTGLMFDTGISAKRISNGLKDGNFAFPSAIFITHEHSDHIQGLENTLKNNPVPVYGTKGTLQAAASTFKGHIPAELFNYLTPGISVEIGDVSVTAFSSYHDASDPVYYVINAEGKKLCIATDMGHYTDKEVTVMSGSDILYLESNYDYNMLLAGSYPYYLKRRIDGPSGHLSNDMSAELAVRLLNPKLKLIMLAHLSKENNYAELAYETMRQAIEQAQVTYKKPLIMVANRDIPTDIINF